MHHSWWRQNSSTRASVASHHSAVPAYRSMETQSMRRECVLCCFPAMLWSLLTPVCRVSAAPMVFQLLKFTQAVIDPKNSVIFNSCSRLCTPVFTSLTIPSKGSPVPTCTTTSSLLPWFVIFEGGQERRLIRLSELQRYRNTGETDSNGEDRD